MFLFSALQHVMVEPREDSSFFYSEAIMGVIINQSKNNGSYHCHPGPVGHCGHQDKSLSILIC